MIFESSESLYIYCCEWDRIHSWTAYSESTINETIDDRLQLHCATSVFTSRHLAANFPITLATWYAWGDMGDKGETDDKQAEITSGRRKSKNSIKKPTTEVGL